MRASGHILITALLAAMLADASVAQEPAQFERGDQLRAGYLLNFIKFVEWPGQPPRDSWTICFMGADGVRNAINAALSTKRPGTAGVTAHQLTLGESLAPCQLLYLDGTAPEAARVAGGPTQGVLTVSGSLQFLQRGGVVELFTEGNHLRFNISLDNARHAGLRISSSLLQLASHVEESSR